MGPIDSLERDSLILLHAPIGRDAKLLHDLLHRARLKSQVCLTVDELCREVESGVGAVFLTEESREGNAVQRISSVLQRQGAWSDGGNPLNGIALERFLGQKHGAHAALHLTAKLVDRQAHLRFEARPVKQIVEEFGVASDRRM